MLAGIAQMDAHALREQCVYGGHRALAFMEFRFLSHAAELPYSLPRGDVDANMTALKAGAKPSEEVAGKIWELLWRNVPWAIVRRLIELIGEAPWTSTAVEQLHAQLALMSRFRPDLELGALLARTTTSIANKRLPRMGARERKMQRLRATLGRLDRKNPNKAGGRHIYVQDLSELASRSVAVNLTKLAKKRVYQKIIKKHGRR